MFFKLFLPALAAAPTVLAGDEEFHWQDAGENVNLCVQNRNSMKDLSEYTGPPLASLEGCNNAFKISSNQGGTIHAGVYHAKNWTASNNAHGWQLIQSGDCCFNVMRAGSHNDDQEVKIGSQDIIDAYVQWNTKYFHNRGDGKSLEDKWIAFQGSMNCKGGTVNYWVSGGGTWTLPMTPPPPPKETST